MKTIEEVLCEAIKFDLGCYEHGIKYLKTTKEDICFTMKIKYLTQECSKCNHRVINLRKLNNGK